jgi:hypothetical protein
VRAPARITRFCWEALRQTGRGAQHAQDLLRRLVLGDVRDSPGGHGKVADPRVERQEDDLALREVRAQHAADLEPGHARHRVVQDDQIGLEAECLARRLVAICGLGDDLEVRIGFDERAQSSADRVVIVGDENAYGHGISLICGASCAIGPGGDLGVNPVSGSASVVLYCALIRPRGLGTSGVRRI